MSDAPPDTAVQHQIYRLFGARVKEEREARGLTQSELAAEVHLSRSSIANIERGSQAVTLHALYRIARALDRDAAELLPSASDIEWPEHPSDPDLVVEGSPTISRWLASVTTDQGQDA